MLRDFEQKSGPPLKGKWSWKFLNFMQTLHYQLCFCKQPLNMTENWWLFRPRAQENETFVCEVESWCPIEVDRLPLGGRRALMEKAKEYTVFIKNSVAFPYFGHEYARNNLIGKDGKPCMFKKFPDGNNNGCQIFRLGDMVEFAQGNWSQWVKLGAFLNTHSFELEIFPWKIVAL